MLIDTLNMGNKLFEEKGHPLPSLFTPDMPHMLKLARNALCDLKILVDGKGDQIKWIYIQMLHEEQYDIGLKYGNKL